MTAEKLVLGPWTFTWTPDGDDPGVGTATVRRATVGSGDHPDERADLFGFDGVTREEWDAFVTGATL
jgi:hypothetical protein